jgi:hypothetical protein
MACPAYETVGQTALLEAIHAIADMADPATEPDDTAVRYALNHLDVPDLRGLTTAVAYLHRVASAVRDEKITEMDRRV